MKKEIKTFLSLYYSLFALFLPVFFIFILISSTMETQAKDITVYTNQDSSEDIYVHNSRGDSFYVNDEKIQTRELEKLEQSGDSFTTREGSRVYKMYGNKYYYETGEK